MPPDKKGIGRGLAAILPSSQSDGEGLREIPLDLIAPNPRQPRSQFDDEALAHLADSIKARGVLQPLVARQIPDGSFELLAGERRLRAAKIAGLETVPTLVRAADDWERLDLALAENMAREDLNPIDEARACSMLVEDLGITKQEVGRRVGRSRVAISNLIRLLDLPDEALELIETGKLSEGHGRALLLCKDHAERKRLALAARDEGWSVRETERRARGERRSRQAPEGGDPPRPRGGAGGGGGRSLGGPWPRGPGPREGRWMPRRDRFRRALGGDRVRGASARERPPRRRLTEARPPLSSPPKGD